MPDTYTTKQASELTGASPQAIRVYTGKYARYLSTEATPEPGKERRFTVADLRVVRFVYEQTKTGVSHEEAAAQLAAGALEQYPWQPPETPPQATEPPAASESMALVPLATLQATQALLQAERLERERLIEREAALQARIEELRQALGHAEGELAAVRSTRRKPPAWWVALFGGQTDG